MLFMWNESISICSPVEVEYSRNIDDKSLEGGSVHLHCTPSCIYFREYLKISSPFLLLWYSNLNR